MNNKNNFLRYVNMQVLKKIILDFFLKILLFKMGDLRNNKALFFT